MAVVMGPNQYGKAEVRMVAVDRGGPRHHLRDLTVSTTLRGDFTEAHRTGDNSAVLPTDTQKNTVHAFAQQQPVGEIEDFALRLAHHFVESQPAVREAQVQIEEHAWERVPVGGSGHDHAFHRAGDEKRTAAVTFDGAQAHVLSGLRDLVVLKTTGSEFRGFPRDGYTTLAETDDRVLATAVTARWRHLQPRGDWAKNFAAVRADLLETFATTHSRALQHTLHEMGRIVLDKHSGIAEVRMSLPNKHHFAVDMTPFGMANRNEVFFVSDRPYGLIEGTVTRDDVEAAPEAWYGLPEF